MRFDTKIVNASLDKWVDIGVLNKKICRRISVCPECSATCTVAEGCNECGSFDIQHTSLNSPLCLRSRSHLNRVSIQGLYQLSKVLIRGHCTGADFELIRTHYVCNDCNHNSDVTAEVGCCLKCDLHSQFRWHLRSRSLDMMLSDWTYWLSSIPRDELVLLVASRSYWMARVTSTSTVDVGVRLRERVVCAQQNLVSSANKIHRPSVSLIIAGSMRETVSEDLAASI